MRPALLAALPSLIFALGCMSGRSDRGSYALDYHIDRPRVLAMAVQPPVLVHGQPVTVHALALGPHGADADAISVDVCGLETDRVVAVFELDCFHSADLVTHIGDGPDVSWEPPDLSALVCPYPPDTGIYDTAVDPGEDPGEPDPDTDTDVPPAYAFECGSEVPILATATFGKDDAYAALRAQVRLISYQDGEYVPPGRWAADRTLTYTGEAVAGGQVDLTFTIAAESSRFSWFVDAGELRGTGWTANIDPDFENRSAVTHNTLIIPADWHGPLRVVAVAVDDGWTWGVGGDSAWSVLTLEVP